jgi:hypothetical protein
MSNNEPVERVYDKTRPTEQTSNNELDKILDNQQVFDLEQAKQQLSNLIKEIINDDEQVVTKLGIHPKEIRNNLRTEQRDIATNLGFNIGGQE